MDVVIGGTLVHYLEFNPLGKKTLLILHGWGHEASWWADFAKRFDGYRVVVPDLPAFGRSQALGGEASVPEYADWCRELCRELKLTHIVLVGHSTGGQIAAYVAAKKLVRIEKLILVAPALVRYEEKVVPFSIRVMRWLARFKPYMPKMLVNMVSTSTDYGAASPTQREILKRLIRFSVEPLLSQFTCRLYVCGERKIKKH
jgi:pimeloyl-ACP methyl ester carboxylesterase